jgi:protein-disulfide isomerase
MIEQLSAEFPGRIVVRRIDFPLSTRCNENVAATIHPSACDAAILMRQARAVGRESEALALVYGQQEVLTPSLIAAFAAQLRLPFDGTDPAMLASIRADADFGHAVGVQGVPTYFVNGVQVYGWLPRQLEAVIRADLAEGAPSAIPAHK